MRPSLPLAAVALAAALLSCSPRSNLESRLRELAGSDAIDCGRVDEREW